MSEPRLRGEPTRRGALGLLAAGAVGAYALAGLRGRAISAPLPDARPITVKATPVDHFSLRHPEQRRFGKLDFLGGLDLSGSDERFGGFSALNISADGTRLVAVSDKATWLGATLVSKGDAPFELTDAVLAPVLGPDGRPLAGTRRYDTESLAVADGVAFMGLERVNEVLRFAAFGRQGFAAQGQSVPVPAGVKALGNNRGLEALAVVPSGPYAGSLIGVAERSPERDSPVSPGFFILGPDGKPGGAGFEVIRSDGFDITDAAFLPSGDLLLLERRFAWLTGVAMRIRRFDGKAVRPGARIDGEPLITADMAMHIDNMEGLAIHREKDGGVVLTLISDDNFSVLQRTLLLRFRLVD